MDLVNTIKKIIYGKAKAPHGSIGRKLSESHKQKIRASWTPERREAERQRKLAYWTKERRKQQRLAMLGNCLKRKPLTDDKVRAIRKDTRKQVDIAKAFGVAQSTVSLIKRKKIYENIKD